MFITRDPARALAGVGAILLSACGASGGGPDAGAAVNVLAIDPVAGGEVLKSGGGEISIRGDRSTPEAIVLRLGAAGLTFDPALGDSIGQKDGLYELKKGDLSAEGLIDLRQPYVANARARTAMSWTAPTTGFLTVEVDGLRSRPESIPTEDSVTYTGEAIGYFHWDPEGLDYVYSTRADMTLTADFADGTVTFSTRNSVGYRPSTGDFDYAPVNADGSGAISASVFSGKLTNGLGGTGTFSGGFYGPSGENVGGTMEYDGSLAVGVASFSGS